MNQPQIVPLHVCSGYFKNYSYLVFAHGSKDTLIIDPAWEFEKYINVFSYYKVTPNHILLTHTHYDHMNLVDYFVRHYETKVWVSEIERSRFYPRCGLIRTFSHMNTLNLNGLECTVFSTPGHSPGSSCFLIGKNLFSGDTLFIEGCGICGEFESNPGDLYESLKFIKKTVLPDVKVYPGHRFQAYPGQTMEYVLANNIYLHFKTKKEFIDFRMRNNQLNDFNFK